MNGDPCAEITLEYLSQSTWSKAMDQDGRRPLAVVGFGEDLTLDFAGPVLNVPAPVPGQGRCIEMWWSSDPVFFGVRGNLYYARTNGVVIGALVLSDLAASGLQALTRDAYLEILDFLSVHDGWRILRIWNYLSQINLCNAGLERYAEFCIGRHEALTLRNWDIPVMAPAACTLGIRSGPLHIYFLAACTAGQQIENPRQMPAYRYPERYGPRSPSFARATRARIGKLDYLFISGTASVVGHESLHGGDASSQCLEILANLETLAAHCDWPAGHRLDAIEPALYKVYLRHAEDDFAVRSIILNRLNPKAEVMFLHADICRSDLTVEIEAIWTTASVR